MTTRDDSLGELGITAERVPTLSPGLRTALTQHLLRWDQHHVAQWCLEQLIETHGHLVSLHDALARSYVCTGMSDQALEIMRLRHLRRVSNSSRILEARAHLAAGNAEAAQEIATTLTAQHPDMVAALDLQIDISLAGPNWQATESSLRRRESLSPGALATAEAFARLWQARGKPDKALLWARTALARARRQSRQPPIRLLRQLEHLCRATGQLSQAQSTADELSQRYNEELADLKRRLDEERRAAGTDPASRVSPVLSGSGSHSPSSCETSAPVRGPSVLPNMASPAPDLQPFPEVIAGALVPTSDERSRLQFVLGRDFRHRAFRPGQLDVLTALLRGESVLAVMPTGSGKSLCYQLISQLLPGTTLVLSPLVALMKDQMDGLPPALSKRATALHHTLERTELNVRLASAGKGAYKLVYAAPERLRQWPFLHALQAAGTSLLVVDEAHCVSLWGHDFRPDYLFIADAWQQLGRPPILAMTATATPRVQDDIQSVLGHMRLIITDVHRPNLRLEAHRLGAPDKKQALLALCLSINGSGIVYARARRTCEDLAQFLCQHGVDAIHYHAGLRDRPRAQELFMSGAARVIVATIAFGMGVDKADVRFVIHYNMPQSLENYYQEAGRAGRDGLPARCILFHERGDTIALRHLIKRDRIAVDFLRTVYAAIEARLGSQRIGPVAPADLQRDVAADDTTVRVAVQLLESGGLLRRGYDVPRSVTLMLKRDPDHQADDVKRFLEAARLSRGQRLNRSLASLSAETGLDVQMLEGRLLKWMNDGWIDFRGTGRDMLLELSGPPGGSWDTVTAVLGAQARGQDARLAQLIAYAGSSGCRHSFISRYFGGRSLRGCQSCDNCVGNSDANLQGLVCSTAEPRTPTDARRSQTSPTPPKPRAIPAVAIASGEQDTDQSYDERLFERLRSWRREQASRDAVPAFVIFHDSVLQRIASLRPSTLEQLARVKGVGPKKLNQFGLAVLEIIAEHHH